MITTQQIIRNAGLEVVNRTQLRPCVACGTEAHEGDQYCAECGHKVHDILDDLNAWQPETTISDKLYGAQLAAAIRKQLKQFYPQGIRVRTHDGRVRVEVPRTQPNGRTAANRDEYLYRFHEAREGMVLQDLENKLHRAFKGSGGAVNDNPYADYHYLILPQVTVRARYS